MERLSIYLHERDNDPKGEERNADEEKPDEWGQPEYQGVYHQYNKHDDELARRDRPQDLVLRINKLGDGKLVHGGILSEAQPPVERDQGVYLRVCRDDFSCRTLFCQQ